MTLLILLVLFVVLIGAWSLLATGHMLNVRQTQPSVLLLARILFVISVVLMVLIHIGSIDNSNVSR
jgi:hypothetical protein